MSWHLRAVAAVIVMIVALGSPAFCKAEELADRTARLEQQIDGLRKELAQIKAEQKKQASQTRARLRETAEQSREEFGEFRTSTLSLLDRVKFGGYGSVRFESNSLNQVHNTFTLRRLVFTTDATIAPRLHFYSELEYERFRKLELERPALDPTLGGLKATQAIEGTDGSEISLEQGFLQFDINDWIALRAGAVLVPLGRFNLHHDDNLWNLTRRSLVDRGAPVLPATAAWDELGAGFIGRIPVGRRGLLDYQVYVLNGVALDSEIESVVQTRAGDTAKLAAEVELAPQTGTFANDSKGAKAVAGRIAWSPAPGQEIAPSFYWGRYTPGFLPDRSALSVGLDGLSTWGPFQIEGEWVFTRFEGTEDVAKGFARRVGKGESEAETGDVETEVDFELSRLAHTKHGYWLEGRYSFWPSFLDGTFLAREFRNPQLVAITRWEQVWFSGLVQEASFSGGLLTDFRSQSRLLNRITVGLAWRPTPLVGFTLAYEYTRTNAGQSLSEVTNFIPAGPQENDSHALLVGASFGF